MTRLLLTGREPERPTLDLRRLHVLALIGPAAFATGTLFALHEFTHRSGQGKGEHILAAVILSIAAYPFSRWIFRAFARLQEQLAARARRLKALHESSLQTASQVSVEAVRERAVAGALAVVSGVEAFALTAEPRYPAGYATTSHRPPDAWTKAALNETLDGTSQSRKTAERSLLTVPVVSGTTTLGAIAVARNAADPFGSDDLLMLDTFAVAVALGLANARRLETLQLSTTIDERERIARDLHDDLGQLLGFLTAKVQAARELTARGRLDDVDRELDELEMSTRTLASQVREAILGLRARIAGDRPLGLALKEYALSVEIQAGINCRFEGASTGGSRLSPATQYHLLRIAQEAVSNIRRHAHAAHTTIGLVDRDDLVELTIEDDGIGFDTTKTAEGFGLSTMAERAAAIGSTLSIRSNPGHGTRVGVRISGAG